MYRRCLRFLYTTHSTRAVPFVLSSDNAIESIKDLHNSRLFGASPEYMEFKHISAEYIPYFLCKGELEGSYVAEVDYSETVSDGKSGFTTYTRTITTSSHDISVHFQENSVQIYGGYKFSNRTISKVLKDDQIPLHMKKISDGVDLSHANLNDFEMSTTTLQSVVKTEAIALARVKAETFVRGFHPTATSIRINFSTTKVLLFDVYPVFLPAYVSKIVFDGDKYTMYVNGRTGMAAGAYLLCGVTLGRLSSVAAFLTVLFFSPIKLYGAALGSLLSVPVYYAVYYAARALPIMIRDKNRKERARRQAAQSDGDSSGFKPSSESRRRVFEERQRSQTRQEKEDQYNRKRHFDNSNLSNNGKPNDIKGFYRLLGLQGDEDVSDIRQAFRKKVLTAHPDIGGDPDKMKEINEAYRTLRNPQKRAEYDKM